MSCPFSSPPCLGPTNLVFPLHCNPDCRLGQARSRPVSGHVLTTQLPFLLALTGDGFKNPLPYPRLPCSSPLHLHRVCIEFAYLSICLPACLHRTLPILPCTLCPLQMTYNTTRCKGQCCIIQAVMTGGKSASVHYTCIFFSPNIYNLLLAGSRDVELASTTASSRY